MIHPRAKGYRRNGSSCLKGTDLASSNQQEITLTSHSYGHAAVPAAANISLSLLSLLPLDPKESQLSKPS
jgi:hypothetical protein